MCRDGKKFEEYYRKTAERKLEMIFSCSHAHKDFVTVG